jgi:hypothetical protein
LHSPLQNLLVKSPVRRRPNARHPGTKTALESSLGVAEGQKNAVREMLGLVIGKDAATAVIVVLAKENRVIGSQATECHVKVAWADLLVRPWTRFAKPSMPTVTGASDQMRLPTPRLPCSASTKTATARSAAKNCGLKCPAPSAPVSDGQVQGQAKAFPVARSKEVLSHAETATSPVPLAQAESVPIREEIAGINDSQDRVMVTDQVATVRAVISHEVRAHAAATNQTAVPSVERASVKDRDSAEDRDSVEDLGLAVARTAAVSLAPAVSAVRSQAVPSVAKLPRKRSSTV